MTRNIVVKSFEELAQVLDMDELRDHQATPAPWPEPAPCLDEEPPALEGLLAELEGIRETLFAIRRRDQEARDVALEHLARYDQVAAQRDQSEETRRRASAVRLEAERIAQDGFAEDVQTEARSVAGIAARIETVAFGLAERLAREADTLAAQVDLGRVLAERRKREEQEKARAAEAQKAERLSGALAAASEALQAGDFQEARRVMGIAGSRRGGPLAGPAGVPAGRGGSGFQAHSAGDERPPGTAEAANLRPVGEGLCPPLPAT